MFIRNIGLVSRTYRHVNRYRQILAVLFKYGFGDLVDSLRVGRYVELGAQILQEGQGRAGGGAHEARAHPQEPGRAGAHVHQAGTDPLYQADLVPVEIVTELAKLQDSVEPFPFEKAQELIERELGAPAATSSLT